MFGSHVFGRHAFGQHAYEVPIFAAPQMPMLQAGRLGPEFGIRPRAGGFPGASVYGLGALGTSEAQCRNFRLTSAEVPGAIQSLATATDSRFGSLKSTGLFEGEWGLQDGWNLRLYERKAPDGSWWVSGPWMRRESGRASRRGYVITRRVTERRAEGVFVNEVGKEQYALEIAVAAGANPQAILVAAKQFSSCPASVRYSKDYPGSLLAGGPRSVERPELSVPDAGTSSLVPQERYDLTPQPPASPDAGVQQAAKSGGFPWLWVGLGVGALIIVGGGVVLARRRAAGGGS